MTRVREVLIWARQRYLLPIRLLLWMPPYRDHIDHVPADCALARYLRDVGEPVRCFDRKLECAYYRWLEIEVR